jgi:hypothetical protein
MADALNVLFIEGIEWFVLDVGYRVQRQSLLTMLTSIITDRARSMTG